MKIKSNILMSIRGTKMNKLYYYLEKYCNLKSIKSYFIQINNKMITFINSNNEMIEKSLNYIKQEIAYLFNVKIKKLEV